MLLKLNKLFKKYTSCDPSPSSQEREVHKEKQNVYTLNPLLSPPGGLFFSSTFEGGFKREARGGLIYFSKTHHL